MSGYTIKYFILAILIVGFLFANLKAQQLSDPAKEEAVKLSGDYYWEEASAKSITDAKDLARELLLKRILLDYNSKVDMNNVKSIQVEGIDYLLYIRGPKNRIIAFIEKKNVTELLETLKELHSVVVIHSDKYSDDINEKPEPNQIDSGLVSESNFQPIDETVLDNSHSQIEIVDSSDLLSEQNSGVNNDQELTYTNRIKTGQGLTRDEIRRELSKIRDASDMSQLVNHYKLKGKLVFGRKEVFENPENCDIVIINPETKEVLAYLLQIDNKFINYNSNEVITDYYTTFNGMTAIWIQYFEN